MEGEAADVGEDGEAEVGFVAALRLAGVGKFNQQINI